MSSGEGLLSGLRRSVTSRGGWQLMLGQIGPKLASSITVLISAALLGPDGRGELAFAMATASLVAAVAVFGLFIPASRSEGAVPRQYFDIVVLFAVVADVLLLAVAFIAPVGLLTPQFSAVVAVNAAALAVVAFSQHVLQVRVSDREYFLFGAVWPVGINGVLVIALVLGADVRGFLLLWTAMNVTLAGWAVWRLFTRTQVARVRPGGLAPYLAAAAPFGVSYIAASLATRGDITVLGIVSTEYEVGQYSLATSISGLLFMVSQVFTLRVASLHKSLDPERYGPAVRRLAAIAVIAVALLSVPLMALAWLVVPWLLPDFTAALLPMAVLCLAALPETYARVHSWALGMTSANNRLMAYAAVSVGVFVAYFFAARWGAIGVAIASVIGYSAQAVVVSYRVRWPSSDTGEATSVE